jgi:hypothetical protein
MDSVEYLEQEEPLKNAGISAKMRYFGFMREISHL